MIIFFNNLDSMIFRRLPPWQLSRWPEECRPLSLGHFPSSASPHHWPLWSHFLPPLDHVILWQWLRHLHLLDNQEHPNSGIIAIDDDGRNLTVPCPCDLAALFAWLQRINCNSFYFKVHPLPDKFLPSLSCVFGPRCLLQSTLSPLRAPSTRPSIFFCHRSFLELKAPSLFGEI